MQRKNEFLSPYFAKFDVFPKEDFLKIFHAAIVLLNTKVQIQRSKVYEAKGFVFQLFP